MVNHEEDIKARTYAYGEFTTNNYSFRQSTGCMVRQAKGAYGRAHQMCYGGLATLITNTSEYIINNFQIGLHRYIALTEEDRVFFLDYLMNESPFAECFIEHDAKWSVNNGITYHKIEMPGNMVIAGLSAVREMWESYSIQGIYHFKKLVDAGCTKDFAWLFCCYLSEDGKKINTGMYDGGHAVWPVCSALVEDAINYIKHNPVGAFKKNFNNEYPYTGVHQLFMADNPLIRRRSVSSEGNKFINWLVKNSDKTVEEKIYTQPWETSTKAKMVINLPLKDMIKEAVKLNDLFYKEHIK